MSLDNRNQGRRGDFGSCGRGRDRRNIERSLYSDLSQRYKCTTKSWTQPRLLSEGKHRVLRCTKQHSAYPLLDQCLRTSIISQRLTKLCQRPERRHRRRRRLQNLSKYLEIRILLSLFFHLNHTFFTPPSRTSMTGKVGSMIGHHRPTEDDKRGVGSMRISQKQLR